MNVKAQKGYYPCIKAASRLHFVLCVSVAFGIKSDSKLKVAKDAFRLYSTQCLIYAHFKSAAV